MSARAGGERSHHHVVPVLEHPYAGQPFDPIRAVVAQVADLEPTRPDRRRRATTCGDPLPRGARIRAAERAQQGPPGTSAAPPARPATVSHRVMDSLVFRGSP